MKLLLSLSMLLSSPAFAITYEIVGPCEEAPAYQGVHAVASGSNAGAATMEIISRHSIPFLGSEGGVNSMMGTPVGDDAIEVISDTEMRAYGWCYEVDGRQPDVMPDQIVLTGSEHLKWFYAFSYYKAGAWLTYCEPAYTVRPEKLCSSR